jgi:hypothetical protein
MYLAQRAGQSLLSLRSDKGALRMAVSVEDQSVRDRGNGVPRSQPAIINDHRGCQVLDRVELDGLFAAPADHHRERGTAGLLGRGDREGQFLDAVTTHRREEHHQDLAAVQWLWIKSRASDRRHRQVRENVSGRWPDTLAVTGREPQRTRNRHHE